MGLAAMATTARGMAATVRVLGRGELGRFTGGDRSEVARFETDLAAHVGTRHALAVNSGTSALVAALVGAGIGPGDEVLVPAYTWVSTAAAALAVGAVPVLVEVDASLTMDPVDLDARITPRSRAVLPVHMGNHVADMDPIMEVAAAHDLLVVEDACQAIGVTYRGRRVGSIGHAGCFSFNQHKNIRAGEGGALVTNDSALFDRAAMYHDVGSYERDGFTGADANLIVGVNLRMPELSAAVLRPQLATLDAQIARRRRHRGLVLEALAGRVGRDLRPIPHHDPVQAAGLAVQFGSPEAAARFGANRGVHRLIDTGRHVYTNWRSLQARNPLHPALDPYAAVDGEIDHGPDACPRTLEILARTCAIDLAPELPTPAFRLLARRIAG
ncbi:DegT/DnrJ/EryC1/StrS family aminotransferase [Pseudonocardia parietis]|uniref:dTDP-4-amino-4,6-dideoxygalactose transaminase n=1 Tax=Pseudonocardia parietis TaxID=570936 RepID=A0ABS4W2T6_9PSEU|nr:DegT/DnrJ/EryC1/StrS family aminotransferase [Pseudonocardia parietis]MBP2370465.1 dTDP-4-amino-4,6-dideoxygalactose transaminase [Pseudonocardia parietis]